MKAINGAVIGAVALSAALLLACGSSADQSSEAPGDAPQVDATTQPTPAVATTPVEPTSDGPAGTPAADVPSVSPEPVTSEPDPVASGVGYIEEVYTDYERVTPPSGDDPGRDSRTLRTLIVYPAAADGASALVESASPAGGPYPLVLFAHGLGGFPEGYGEILAAVASGGYVVVAPEFPRSSRFNPGGPDAGDTGSQPGDLSFLIDTVVERAADPQWPLAGMVDNSQIAAIGHSNGAITVLGISANSCCRDERVDAVGGHGGSAGPV